MIRKKSLSSCGVDGTDRVIAIQYLCDQTALCIATTNGEIIFWHVGQGDVEVDYWMFRKAFMDNG